MPIYRVSVPINSVGIIDEIEAESPEAAIAEAKNRIDSDGAFDSVDRLEDHELAEGEEIEAVDIDAEDEDEEDQADQTS